MILPTFLYLGNTFSSSKPNSTTVNSTANKGAATVVNQSTPEGTESLMLSFSSRGYASTERVPPAKVYSDPVPESLKRHSATRKTNSMPIGARSHSSFSSPTGLVSPLFSSLREERRPASLLALDNYVHDMNECDNSDHCHGKNEVHRVNRDVTEAKSKKWNSENKSKLKKLHRNTYRLYEHHNNINANYYDDDDDYEDSDNSDEYDDFANNGIAISSPIFHVRSKNNSVNNRDAWQNAQKNSSSPDAIKSKSCHIFREHEREKSDFDTDNVTTNTTTTTTNVNNDTGIELICSKEKVKDDFDALYHNVIKANGRASLSTSSSPVFPINCWHLPWNQHKVQMCRYCHRPLPPERTNNANASVTPATINKTPRAVTSPVRTGVNNVTTEGENATLVKIVDEGLIAFVASENDIHDVLDGLDVDDDDSDDDEIYRSGMFGSNNAGYCHCKFASVTSPNQHDESMSKLAENVNNNNNDDTNQSLNKKTLSKKNRTPSRPPSPVLYVVETRHSHSRQLTGTVNLNSFSSSSSESTASSSSSSLSLHNSSPIPVQELAKAQQLNGEEENLLEPSQISASLPQSASAQHAEHLHKRTTSENTTDASTAQKTRHKSKSHNAGVRLSLVLPLTNSLLHKKTLLVHDNESSPVNASKDNTKSDINQQDCPPTSFASSQSPKLQQHGEKQLEKTTVTTMSKNEINKNNNNNSNINSQNKSSLNTSKKGSTVSSWVKEQRERLSSLYDSKSPTASSKPQASKVK